MKELELNVVERAKTLLKSGEVQRVVGWKKGEFYFDPSPATFESEESLSEFVYNGFCGANLSKYLIEKSKEEGKTAVFVKPCDAYSLNQLLKENRLKREKVYVVGIECQGMLDISAIKENGVDMITETEEREESVLVRSLYGDRELEKEKILLEKCKTCKSKAFPVFDETIVLHEMKQANADRFSVVKKLESMTSDERFSFWRGELSKCIRCNACRNVCPACSCVKCVFDNPSSGIAAKANDDQFEEQLFHIIRAYHVAGRCTDCGECSRVCPQKIPLHLINRKFIKDANEFYGEYQAGETSEGKTPLTEFKEEDVEAGEIFSSEAK